VEQNLFEEKVFLLALSSKKGWPGISSESSKSHKRTNSSTKL
jgi:hypothetical protein